MQGRGFQGHAGGFQVLGFMDGRVMSNKDNNGIAT